jgi:hypothetical protein
MYNYLFVISIIISILSGLYAVIGWYSILTCIIIEEAKATITQVVISIGIFLCCLAYIYMYNAGLIT